MLSFRVFEIGNGGQLGGVELLSEPIFFFVTIDGEEVRAQDQENALPFLEREDKLATRLHGQLVHTIP